MAKNLSERIAERAKKKTPSRPSRNAQNRAAFLAVRVDVKQARDDGWPIKSIWETLHSEGKVTFSYQAFRGYVNRLILAVKADATPSPAGEQTKPSEDAKLETATSTTKPKPALIPSFTFQPNPDKKDLL